MSPEAWSAVAAIASAAVAAVALIFGWRQIQLARRAVQVGILVPLYQEHLSSDFDNIRQLIRAGKSIDNYKTELKPEQQIELRNYINLLNFVGILVGTKLLNRRDAKAVFEHSATDCQKVFAQYLKDQRDLDVSGLAKLS